MTLTADYQILPATTPEALRDAVALMASVHRRGPERDGLEEMSTRYPGFSPEHIRTARAGDEVVSALRITTDTLLLGEARLRLGGVGWIATAPHHRHRGLARALLLDAFDYLARQNYHVCMVFGIPGFYGQFGFTACLPDYTVLVDTNEALGFERALELRAAKSGVVPVLQRIHAQHNMRIPCSLARTSAHYMNRWHLWRGWHTLGDREGRVHGYFIATRSGNHLRVDDAGIDDKCWCPALVAATGALAAEASLHQIRFHVPPNHPLARYLAQFRSVHETHVDRDAGGMMRFVNVGETLESMIPEWEGLVAGSVLRDTHTECTLVTGPGQGHRIRAHRGAIDIAPGMGTNKVSLTPADLMHLVTGFRHLDDILEERRALLSPEARTLLQTIFPKRAPYMWPFDHF
jgi:predicted acetyltransferase